tara:strand:+ start:17659 stop:17778 length:120 start_codon:yes stop_codon:yes gene_type:complete
MKITYDRKEVGNMKYDGEGEAEPSGEGEAPPAEPTEPSA